MKDLIRCTVSRDDFQRWLDLGTAPITLRQDEKVMTTLLKLEKNPSADYLGTSDLISPYTKEERNGKMGARKARRQENEPTDME